MTTNVTVTTHDWPVEVIVSEDINGDLRQTKSKIISNSITTFYITKNKTLHFKELPKE